ncbi:MAG: hypothetical protein RIR01_1351 [Bacteroidota bacterium]
MAQDLLQQLQAIRAKAVNNLESQHQKLLTDTLRTLEQRVVASVSDLPIQDGALFNTRLAIEIRPKLQQAIDELYLSKVQTFINDYDKIAGTIVATYGKLPIPEEFKQITEADLVTIQQLKKIAFSQFQNLATEFTNTLAQEVYQSTLVGKPITEMVQTIRDKINGIYQQADTKKQKELVDFVQAQRIAGKTNTEDFKTAVDELKQSYGSTVTGANLAVYSSQIVQDALMGFDGQFAKFRADEIGINSFIYYGSIIRDSRDFCVEHVNKIFTEDEARELWQNEWQGKSGSDPFIDRGGYNCRHHWQPVDPEWGTIKEDGTFEYDINKFEQPVQQTTITQQTTTIVPPVATATTRTGINISSLDNPITADKLQTVPKAITVKSLQEQIINASKDARYPLDANGVAINRFRNPQDIGKISLGNISDKLLTQMSVVKQELDDLADKYNIPKLRGIVKTRANARSIMSMGDGKLNVNVGKSENLQKYRNFYLDKFKTKDVTWKFGDNLDNRPYNAFIYFDNQLDQLRNVMYHEFAHHVHQMKGVTGTTANYGTRFTPTVEEKLRTITRNLRKSATRYGDKDPYEWFAENFSLYEMKRTDLVDPQFIKFIKEI